jgi:hypothetical protein
MKSLKFVLTLIVAFCFWSAAFGFTGGVSQTRSIDQYFAQNELTIESKLGNGTVLNQVDELEIKRDIYEHHAKSPMQAFAMSLLVPGAGQYYVQSSKYKVGAFIATDLLLWTGYIVYHGKGVDQEDKYRAYANDNYSWQTFIEWWNQLDTTIQNDYSHTMPWDSVNNRPIFNHEYYENIGKYDQFQVGWPDGLNNPPNDSLDWQSPERNTYLDMRRKANDYFSNATTAAMVSVANHIVSAFDAAIGAKRFNRASKQYSMTIKSKQIQGRTVPFLVLSAKF